MGVPKNCVKSLRKAAALAFFLLVCPTLWPQASTGKPAVPEAQPEAPKDTLGRISPKAAVVGFMTVAHKGNSQIAALYLNTPLRGEDAEELARQLTVVLDQRLPARLNLLSDQPEGSIPDPLRPDEDIIGTIPTANGDLDIVMERIDRGKAGKVWLFSRKTLTSIPDVYRELSTPGVERFLPEFLVKTRVASVQLFEWLTLFVGLPALYLLTGLLDRLLGLGVGALRRRVRRDAKLKNPRVLPQPLRLLLLAIIIRWLLSRIGLPLLARQFWSTTALIIAMGGCVWLLIMLNGWWENYLLARRRNRNLSGSASVLRLLRRMLDGLVFFAGLMFTLYHFGINPTAALAGLGVGGIAVALAAQKTLENVIGGISLIADQAVRAGDALKVGEISGTVEDVGLRSTRIRTLDRTLISVPNSQVASMSLETLSARDKFWFHPLLGLRYETTPAQLRSVISGLRKLLNEHGNVDSDSVRIRFVRLGGFSLDVDIFAYVFGADWNHFLAVQEELLFGIMDVVQQAGTEFAFPSQTMYLAADSTNKLTLLASVHAADATPSTGEAAVAKSA
jgi:MscS family membrane protein